MAITGIDPGSSVKRLHLSALLPVLLGAALAGCASPPPASDGEANLRVSEIKDSSCFEIEREPGYAGGLRIPRQTVCPSAASPQEDKE